MSDIDVKDPAVTVNPPQTSSPGQKSIFLLFLVALVFGSVGGYLIGINKDSLPFFQPKQVACTMDAMVCPDGSSVARVGPNCEFAPCPPVASNDPSANWKTFTDTKYNFSLKYPSDWEKLEADGNYVRFFKGPYNPNLPVPETYISILPKVNSSQKPVRDWLITEGILPNPNNISTHIQEQNVIVGGISAIQILTPENGGQKTVYLPTGNEILQITYVFMGKDQADYDNLVKIFDQILSTFKFLD